MKSRVRTVTSVVAAAMLAFPLSAAAPAAPAAAAPFGCEAIAYEPFVDLPTHSIVGSGAGWCTSAQHPTGETVSVTVSVWKYNRFWFDEELAQATKTGTDVRVAARYRCSGNGHTQAYTKTTVRSRTVMSSNVSANYCS